MFEFLFNFFSNLLHKLGFLNKTATVILLGLDNAGKSTLAYKLKTGKIIQLLPTQAAKEDSLQIADLTLTTIDLGGHEAARHLWKKYTTLADGLIFMVDSADESRLDEAKQELHALLTIQGVYDIPVAIFANKQDIPGAFSSQQIIEALSLNSVAHTKYQLFCTSVVRGEGYTDGFNWLAKEIP
jgi:GTP-binding protein SAR1